MADRKEYTCRACGKNFHSTRNEAEALDEMRKNFGDHYKVEDCSAICDTCYTELMEGACRSQTNDLTEEDRFGLLGMAHMLAKSGGGTLPKKTQEIVLTAVDLMCRMNKYIDRDSPDAAYSFLVAANLIFLAAEVSETTQIDTFHDARKMAAGLRKLATGVHEDMTKERAEEVMARFRRDKP